MSDLLQYKDYQGSVEYSLQDQVLYGQVCMIDSLISYQGQTIEELRLAFEAAVDDYLLYCTKNHLEPNKAYSGNFNVRPGPELHRGMAHAALQMKISMNDAVKKAFTFFLEDKKVINNYHIHRAEPPKIELQLEGEIDVWKGEEVVWEITSTSRH